MRRPWAAQIKVRGKCRYHPHDRIRLPRLKKCVAKQEKYTFGKARRHVIKRTLDRSRVHL